MFWKAGGGQTSQNQNAQAAMTANPLDPKVEATRIKELTGSKSVIIAKQAPKSKLPGL
jgi:hypothetical protein